MLQVGRLGVGADQGHAGVPPEMCLTHGVLVVIDSAKLVSRYVLGIRRRPCRSGDVE